MTASGRLRGKAKLNAHFQNLDKATQRGGGSEHDPLIRLMVFTEVSRTFFKLKAIFLMPKHVDEENSGHLASAEFPVLTKQKIPNYFPA